MKISILGNVFDTDTFNEVSAIRYTRYQDGGYGGYTITTTPELASSAEFTIVFKYSEKHHTIHRSLPSDKSHADEVNKIINLRDAIIKYWSGEQNYIPEINFEGAGGNC